LTATTSGLVVAVIAALGAPAAAAAPRVTLAPAAGPPGSVTVLRGADFSPLSRPVVHRGSHAVARPLTTRRGRFRLALAIPHKTGRRSLTIRVGPSQRLTTVFRLDPRASPTSVSAAASRGARLRWGPTAGPAGTRIRLAAVGLRPGAVARVSFQGVRRRVRVGRRGGLSLALRVAGGRAKGRGLVRAGGIRLPFGFRITPPAPMGAPPPDAPPPGAPGGESSQPQLPVRGFFYYPWFPETWGSLSNHTRYHPSLGFYNSGAPEVIRSHLKALEYGQAEVGISSWWGRGDRPDIRFPALLQETSAVGSPLRWSVYYEPEALGDPSVDQIRSDLAYLSDRYGSHPAFFRVEQRFVVFVYAAASDGCAMVERWKQANNVGAHVVLKLFPGYRECPSQPEGWHQYSASPETSHGRDSFTVSPGFWKWDEQTPRFARDVDRFRQNVRNMAASGASYQLVISFNEWGEGTAVESAQEWSSSSAYGAYLDALHDAPGA
jgi:Glycosyl hydrolase family 99